MHPPITIPGSPFTKRCLEMVLKTIPTDLWIHHGRERELTGSSFVQTNKQTREQKNIQTNICLSVHSFFPSFVRPNKETYKRMNEGTYECTKVKKKEGGGVTQTWTCPNKKTVVEYRSLNSRIRQKGVFWRCRYLRVLVFDQYPYPNTLSKIGGYWYLAEIPIPAFWCKTHPTYLWLGFTKRALKLWKSKEHYKILGPVR